MFRFNPCKKCGCAPAVQPTEFDINVYDACTGDSAHGIPSSPLAGATVVVSGQANSTQTTDSNGLVVYTFTANAGTSYTFNASKTGYFNASTTVQNNPGNTVGGSIGMVPSLISTTYQISRLGSNNDASIRSPGGTTDILNGSLVVNQTGSTETHSVITTSPNATGTSGPFSINRTLSWSATFTKTRWKTENFSGVANPSSRTCSQTLGPFYVQPASGYDYSDVADPIKNSLILNDGVGDVSITNSGTVNQSNSQWIGFATRNGVNLQFTFKPIGDNVTGNGDWLEVFTSPTTSKVGPTNGVTGLPNYLWSGTANVGSDIGWQNTNIINAYGLGPRTFQIRES